MGEDAKKCKHRGDSGIVKSIQPNGQCIVVKVLYKCPMCKRKEWGIFTRLGEVDWESRDSIAQAAKITVENPDTFERFGDSPQKDKR